MTAIHGDAPWQWFSLEGKTAVVTGGAGGIGLAMVDVLLRAGATVVSIDLPGHESVSGAENRPCDLSEPREIHRLVAEIERDHDEVHIVVHACGITRDGRLWKLEDDDWDSVVRVNLDSAFHLLKGLTPLLRRAGSGAVVLLSSINGERGKAGQANYAASKAGLIGLGRTAARELGGFGIRVNVVAPGWIATSMTNRLPESLRDQAVQETALGHVGDPRDVAAAVWFLCSDASRHVTGQVLRVDGGQLIG